jgi:BirA family transcriptional regulator, biotin operon repressor / biotin---[acetyl-CoA-carboxylase] ligase
MPSAYQRRQSNKRQSELEARAQHMRRYQTPSEERLWAELRGGRLGVSFRRQVVIGRYIADFVCAEARLVVEVDGGRHQARARLDEVRDAHLRRAGYHVVRIPAALVTSNLGGAVSLVRSALMAAV